MSQQHCIDASQIRRYKYLRLVSLIKLCNVFCSKKASGNFGRRSFDDFAKYSPAVLALGSITGVGIYIAVEFEKVETRYRVFEEKFKASEEKFKSLLEEKFKATDERINKTREEALKLGTENYLKYTYSSEYRALHKSDGPAIDK